MNETDSPPNFELKCKRNYMDCEFDITFKIDSNCDLEVVCISENGLLFFIRKTKYKKI